MIMTSFADLMANQPSYREKQLKEAVFKNLITDWSEATNLPIRLREELAKTYPLGIKAVDCRSKDRQTIKSLFTLDDGKAVEAVLMGSKDGRKTVCVSSQIGCPLGCKFCATGKMGFHRNLEAGEIVQQVLYFSRLVKPEKITNVVFMGMGEPFLNYDNVLKSIRFMNEKDGFGLGARNFSISTVGIIEGINKLTEEALQINLAISLHAPNDRLRNTIIPSSTRFPIRKILEATDNYINKKKRKVMLEYMMLRGINDSDEHAIALSKLITNPLYMINLIKYNATESFEPSSSERIKMFRQILERRHINVTQRFSHGEDIDAACGQLAIKSGRAWTRTRDLSDVNRTL